MKRESYKGSNAANKARREAERAKLAPAAPTADVRMTVDEAAEVQDALVEARHLLELVSLPLMGSGRSGAIFPVTEVEYKLTKAERFVQNAMLRSGRG